MTLYRCSRSGHVIGGACFSFSAFYCRRKQPRRIQTSTPSSISGTSMNCLRILLMTFIRTGRGSCGSLRMTDSTGMTGIMSCCTVTTERIPTPYAEILLIVFSKVVTAFCGSAQPTDSAGRYNKDINTASFASELYFYRIAAEGNNAERFVAIRKLMLVKQQTHLELSSRSSHERSWRDFFVFWITELLYSTH